MPADSLLAYILAVVPQLSSKEMMAPRKNLGAAQRLKGWRRFKGPPERSACQK